jgi:DNA-binding MarR family transcriptional regulator
MAKATFDDTVQKIGRECLGVRIRMLNRALTQFFDDEFRPLELKAGQFGILLMAASWGKVIPRDLCETLHVDASTMSRNLDRMEAAGWIEHVNDRDGRTQPFQLTALGKKILEQAFPLWERAQARAADLLGDMGVALLRDTTKRLGLKGEQKKK